MQSAAKVGLLVIIFVALLYGAYSFLGDSLFKEKQSTYFAEFSDASGITNGTPVQMAGVKIGTVKIVQLVNPKLARITMEVKPQIMIPENSTASIGGSLIGIGNAPLEIVPPAKLTEQYLASGATLKGVHSSPLEAMLPESRATLKELNLTLAASRKLLENQSLQNKLSHLMDSSVKTLDKFGMLADRAQGLIGSASGVANNANALIAQNQATLHQAAQSASLAMADIRRSTNMLAKLIESGKYQDQVQTLLESLNKTAQKADDLMTSINSFVNDPEVQGNLKSTVANMNKISDTSTRIAANSEEISKNGITISQKAIELTDKANEIADEAKAALQRISGFFNKGVSKPIIPPVQAALDLTRETSPNHWRTDLTGRLQLHEGFLDVGLYDAFESNKVILQLGNPLAGIPGDYRYGIYASKPGVGVDYRIAPRVKLRTDLFDINKPRVDFRTQLDFGNGFVGWLGLEKIFDRNAFSVGVGIRK